MTTAVEVLRAIEVSAELATVPELRQMIRNTLDLLPTLGVDDQAYAHVLLLKLDSLLREQQVDSSPPVEPDPILFDLDALLMEDADARADALLSGLDRWLRGDVHPDSLPSILVCHSPHHAHVGPDGPIEEEASINLRRLASLAAAAIARAAYDTGSRTCLPTALPADERMEFDEPVFMPLEPRGRRAIHCMLCTWTRRSSSGGCTHSAWT